MMNDFEKKALEFLDYIAYLVKHKELTIYDSLFDILDSISLQEGYHLGLKLAERVDIGDNSWFYTYSYNDLLTGAYRDESLMWNNRDVFKNLVLEVSAMGAWQVYLLYIASSILPAYWHGGYSRREFFFNRDNYKGITSSWAEGKVNIEINQIPQPTVEMRDGVAVVSCPYWNDWKGLVLESVTVKFNTDGTITLTSQDKVLYIYHCGICY